MLVIIHEMVENSKVVRWVFFGDGEVDTAMVGAVDLVSVVVDVRKEGLRWLARVKWVVGFGGCLYDKPPKGARSAEARNLVPMTMGRCEDVFMDFCRCNIIISFR